MGRELLLQVETGPWAQARRAESNKQKIDNRRQQAVGDRKYVRKEGGRGKRENDFE
jgi:hypothetical protein